MGRIGGNNPDAALLPPFRVMEGTGYRNPTWYLNDANGVNIAATTDERKAERMRQLVILANDAAREQA